MSYYSDTDGEYSWKHWDASQPCCRLSYRARGIIVSGMKVFHIATMTPVSNTGSSAAGGTEGLVMKRKQMLLGWLTPKL